MALTGTLQRSQAPPHVSDCSTPGCQQCCPLLSSHGRNGGTPFLAVEALQSTCTPRDRACTSRMSRVPCRPAVSPTALPPCHMFNIRSTASQQGAANSHSFQGAEGSFVVTLQHRGGTAAACEGSSSAGVLPALTARLCAAQWCWFGCGVVWASSWVSQDGDCPVASPCSVSDDCCE